MKRTRLAVAATALTLLTAFTVFSQSIVFDSSSSPSDGNCNISTLFYQGQSFRTGGENIFLEQVSLNMAGSYANITVQLYNNGFQNDLGGFVTTLTGASSGSAGVSIYTPSTIILLHSNTTYVVVVFGDSGYWKTTAASPTIGTGTWNEFYVGSGWIGSGNPADTLQMQVVGLRPKLTAMSPLNKTNFQFSVSSLIPSRTNLIQVSTNLSSWTSISTNVAVTNSFNFTDPTPMTNSKVRFYRVTELP